MSYFLRMLTGILTAVACVAPAAAAAAAAPPPNDAPGAATVVPALPTTLAGSTAEATMDIDEPAPLVTPENQRGLDRSVWFAYTPERDRSVLADTCDANFDNHLDVYTGPIGTLVALPTTSDDYSGCPGERRTFSLRAGVTTLLRVTAERVSGRVPDGGVFHLQLTPQEPPAADAFTRATILPGPGTYTASLAFSTIEFGEPASGGDTGSVWFRLSPPRDEPYTARLAPNPFSSALAVYEARGETINGLRRLAYGSAGTEISFNALHGHRYYLRASTTQAVAGDVALSLTTNSARGIGLIVTPARNTLGSLRRSGFKATLSCARTCTLGVDLLIGKREARRLKLVDKGTPLRHALRAGHVGGVLQTGRATTVTVPIAIKAIRSRLAHVSSVHFVLAVTVRGARGSRPVRRSVIVRR
jgi:hypothetical protein